MCGTSWCVHALSFRPHEKHWVTSLSELYVKPLSERAFALGCIFGQFLKVANLLSQDRYLRFSSETCHPKVSLSDLWSFRFSTNRSVSGLSWEGGAFLQPSRRASSWVRNESVDSSKHFFLASCHWNWYAMVNNVHRHSCCFYTRRLNKARMIIINKPLIVNGLIVWGR